MSTTITSPLRRLAVGLTLAFVVTAGCSGGSSGGDRAATVGGETISETDVARLAKEWRAAEAQQEHTDVWKPLPEKRLRQLALLQLIRIKYVAQVAEDRGVGTAAGKVAEVASSEIDDAEFDGTGWGKGSFESAMRSSILSKALAEKVFPDLDIEEAKVRAYYDKHPELNQPTWNAKVGLAFFPKAPAVPVAGGAEFARSARQAGAEEVIAEQAVDADSPLPAELLEAIAQMKAGTVSASIPAGRGHWVVSAIDVRAVAPRTYEQARLDIKEHLIDQDRQARFTMWLTDELRKADIQVEKKFGSWPDDLL